MTLTANQERVLEYLATGYTQKKIASFMGSMRVDQTLGRIYDRLGFTDSDFDRKTLAILWWWRRLPAKPSEKQRAWHGVYRNQHTKG